MTVTDAFDDFPTASTLLVTVQSDEEFYEEGQTTIKRLEHGEQVEDPDTFSFPSVETLFETFNPRTMTLLETIADDEPNSIRETARLVDRDVKNVHEELTELGRLGVIRFESDGRSKRPVLPYDEILIDLPFTEEARSGSAAARP